MSKFGWSYPAGCSGTPYDDEGPLECPVCGKPNADEESGEPIYPESPDCCSAECAHTYAGQLREQAQAEAEFAAELERQDKLDWVSLHIDER
jgi:hypothetical protein